VDKIRVLDYITRGESLFVSKAHARFTEQNALSFFLFVVVLRVLRVLVVSTYKEEYNNASITVELCIQEEEER